jgi:hypothetical protein
MKIQLNEYIQNNRKAIISEIAGPSKNAVDTQLNGYIVEYYIDNQLTNQLLMSSLPAAEELAESYVNTGSKPKFLRD